MTPNNKGRIRHILCPSDLSPKSQKALGFAVRIAETLDADLTTCYCAPATWFSTENRMPLEKTSEIRSLLKQQVIKCENPEGNLRWRSAVIENSFDAARDILNLAKETEADLIVMKARPSVLSAFRFGSIVERVVTEAPCPVLLLPSIFLLHRDPQADQLTFCRILFDYDFSDRSDELFQTVNSLTQRYNAELHMLSVFEPILPTGSEVATAANSRTSLQTMMRLKMDDTLQTAGRSIMDVPTAVEWGNHASSVLRYSKDHKIDLICTTLAPPHFYFEKLYSSYLGNLLRSARCPILVKQAG
ncbi:MAG TPA: universal stress protein [Pyrinomonadaceae bacterium]